MYMKPNSFRENSFTEGNNSYSAKFQAFDIELPETSLKINVVGTNTTNNTTGQEKKRGGSLFKKLFSFKSGNGQTTTNSSGI